MSYYVTKIEELEELLEGLKRSRDMTDKGSQDVTVTISVQGIGTANLSGETARAAMDLLGQHYQEAIGHVVALARQEIVELNALIAERCPS